MKHKEKTVQEINEKINEGNACVVTAAEMSELVAEMGADEAAHEVDVVTTGTFGAMCSSGMWMNFGHSEPPIKMSKVWLNDVEAYAGVAAVDAYLGATQLSESLGLEYGGGHVIEDLVRRKSVHLRAEAYGTDCYPRKNLSVDIHIDEMNQATLSNPRNCYERYAVATNTTGKTLYTYMGKLLPDLGNATFSGAGEISPIINDPRYRTIGVGARIFLGGGEGYIIGNGTQHSPETGFGTLMLQGDLKSMNPDFIRGATMTGYGTTLFVGVGVPIPVLNKEVALSTGISDDQIICKVFDYGVPSRNRPTLREVTYADLKSGTIEINGREVRTAPISSFRVAGQVAELLKEKIASSNFFLTDPVKLLSSSTPCLPMAQRKHQKETSKQIQVHTVPVDQFIHRSIERCINCGLCISYCNSGVFTRDNHWRITDDPSLCVECGECGDICPHKAITLKNRGDTT